MKHPSAKYLSPAKVSKAISLPSHFLSERLRKVLVAVDFVHTPKNLKSLPVTMIKGIPGARFLVHADTGPYEIQLNPEGNHAELSLLHEVGHYLEWQAIPKSRHYGARDFGNDPLFTDWLQVVFESPAVQRLLENLALYPDGSRKFEEIIYLLHPDELWTRAYTQYITKKVNLAVLYQQIAAENKVNLGIIHCAPYWSWSEFSSILDSMDTIFESLGWSK